ncbi:MAG: hypothetical protein ACFCVE_12095 [Phycisphaerae bacterium]
MSETLQHIIVLSAAAACLGYVGFQVTRTLVTGKGKAGSCCAKGCDAVKAEAEATAKQPQGRGTHFIPSDALRRR